LAILFWPWIISAFVEYLYDCNANVDGCISFTVHIIMKMTMFIGDLVSLFARIGAMHILNHMIGLYL